MGDLWVVLEMHSLGPRSKDWSSKKYKHTHIVPITQTHLGVGSFYDEFNFTLVVPAQTPFSI